MVKCPKCGTHIEYSMDFKTLSKLGKTIYFFFICKNCGTIHKRGQRVYTVGGLKTCKRPQQ